MEIKIATTGSDTINYKKLINLQGDLKILKDENYLKFKKNIEENGFIEPVSVWKDTTDNSYKILNGHQRISTVKRMVEKEGYKIKEIPVNFVEASDVNDAKKKLLALTSEYGEMTEQGAIDFLSEIDIPKNDLSSYLESITSFKNIDIQPILDEVSSPTLGDDAGIDVESFKPVQNDANEEGKSAKNNSEEGVTDPMTGLRLLQIFVSDEQMVEVKSQVDLISKKYKLKNTTEAILKSLEIASEE